MTIAQYARFVQTASAMVRENDLRRLVEDYSTERPVAA